MPRMSRLHPFDAVKRRQDARGGVPSRDRRGRRILVASVVLSTAAATMASTPAAFAASVVKAGTNGYGARHALSNNRPTPIPHGAHRDGALPNSHALTLEFALKPRNPAALSAFATAVNTPGNTNYHHFLPRGAFAGRFGATAQAAQTVRRYLIARGLRPGVLDDGLTISVRTTATHAASLLATSFQRYRLASGRVAYTNASTPSLPAEVASSVQGVLGLSTLSAPVPLNKHLPKRPLPRSSARPFAVSRHRSGHSVHNQEIAAMKAAQHVDSSVHAADVATTAGPQPCVDASGTASSGAYTADELAKAYRLSDLFQSGLTGAGQSVGLIELEPFSPADISAYATCYGLSNSVNVENVDGGVGTTGSGSGEAALDIETVMSAAPGASLTVYSGPNSLSTAADVYQKMAQDDTSKVLTSSWGQCEPLMPASVPPVESTYFQQMAAQGQDLYSAAGDSGSEGCQHGAPNNWTVATGDPSSQPFVTAVGGTALTDIGPAPTEKTWNEPFPNGAGGGGISANWSMPTYQSGPGVDNSYSSSAPCAAATGNSATDCREVPDVSAVADPVDAYAVYVGGSWTSIGGTSAASPLWAGIMAVIGQSCQVGFVNPSLYAISTDNSAIPAFNDVTQGDNDYNNMGGGKYPTTTGFDMATGLGTPIATGLQADLCNSLPAPTGVAASPGNGQATVVFGPPAGGTVTGYTVTATDHTTAGNGGQSATVTQSPVVLTGLTNGDSYTFAVVAHNNSQSSLPGITAAIAPSPYVLGSGQGLATGDTLSSPGGTYQLAFKNGDLVDRATATGKAVWSAGTTTGVLALLRPDGAFVVKDQSGTVVFDNGTEGDIGDYVQVEDDGTLDVQSVTGNTLWSPAITIPSPIGTYAGAAQTAIGPAVQIPYGIAVDSAGNLYVPDELHARVLKIAPGASTATTVPITGLGGPESIAIDSHNDIFVADFFGNDVREYNPTTGTTTKLPFPTLNNPQAVTVDSSGDVYVADTENNQILELPSGSSTPQQVPVTDGQGHNLLGEPSGLATDAAGDLYVTSTDFGHVYQVAPGGAVTQLPFTGLAGPSELWVSPQGDVYVADTGHGRIVELPAGSSTPSVLPLPALRGPTSFAMDGAGDMYVSEFFANRVDEFAAGSTTLTVPIPLRGLSQPQAVASDTSGNLFVADTLSSRIVELAKGSSDFTDFYDNPADAMLPDGVAVDRHGNVYVADYAGNQVSEFSGGHKSILPFSGLNQPGALAVDRLGDVYVADNLNNRVLELPAGSSSQIVLPFTGLGQRLGIALDNAGDVFVADYANGKVLELPTGASSPTIVPFGTVTPTAIASDRAGDLFVADASSGHVRELAAGSNTPTTLPVNLTFAFGIAVEPDGTLAVSDTQSNSLLVLPFAAASVPGKPTGVSASRGDNSAAVSWTAPSSNGSAITGYTVTSSPGGLTCTSAGAIHCTVTGLSNGTPYTFTVVATNGVGDSAPSDASNAVTPAAVPGKPTGVSATSGDSSAVVSWSAPAANGSTITGYTVTSSPDGLTCTTTGATQCTVTGLTNGTAYTFTVIATNGVGGSAASDASSAVTPAGVPSMPGGVSAVRGNQSAQVSWSAAAGNGAAVAGYTVTSSPEGKTCTTTTDLSCIVSGLTNGTAYTFTVTATNSVGTGPSGTSNSVTPGAVPDAPSGVSAIGGAGSASVSWSAAAGNGSSVTGYTVTSSPGGLTCMTTTDLSCTVTGLTNGQAYTFTVTATNPVGTGPSSGASNSVTPAAVPDAPGGVTAARGDQSAQVSWSAAAANGSAVTGYLVTSSPDGKTCSTTTDLSCTVTTLTNGQAYTFTVTATNGVGTGPSGSSNSVTPAAVPDAPSGVTAVRGDGSAQVSWQAAAGHGSAVTGYLVTSSPDSKTCSTTTDLSCTVTGLTNGTAYTFAVTATNDVGTGPSGASNSVTPAGAPAAPGGVTAARGDQSAQVSWQAAAENGSAVTGYTATSSPDGKTCSTTTDLSCLVTGLTNGQAYTFTVTATNGVGTGTGGTSNSVTPAAVPAAPGGVTAARGDQSASVSWQAAAGNGSAVTGYLVTSSPDGKTCSTSGALACTVSALTNGQAYTFTVTATNNVGTGPSGTSNSVTPAADPAAPTSVNPTPGDQSVTVSWSAATANGSAVSGYTVTSSPGALTCSTTTALSCTVTGLTNGTAYTFTVTATNGVGTGPGAVSVSTTPRDTTAPTVSVAALPTFEPAGSVGVSFAGTDNHKVVSYDVRYQRALFNGSFGALTYPSTWQATAATTVSMSATKGGTYCFSARSRDSSGNVSAWSAPRCTAVVLDDRSLTASHGWSRGTGSSYYAKTITTTTTKGATLTRTGVQTKRIALLVSRCSSCGSVGVYWNGSLLKKINLKASATTNQQFLAVATFSAVRTGTVTIKELNKRSVRIDGLALSQT